MGPDPHLHLRLSQTLLNHHPLAQAAPAGGGSTLVFIFGTMLVFYFFIMRPQIEEAERGPEIPGEHCQR